MSYISVEEARIIVEKLKEKSVYVAGCGAKCPFCGSWGKRLHRNMKRLDDNRVRRYFICPDCGYRFSAE